MDEAGKANEAKWKYRIGFSGEDGDVRNLKDYLTARLAWLDGQFATLDTFMDGIRNSKSAAPYTRETGKLPIAFANTAGDGTPGGETETVCEGQALHMVFPVDADATGRLDVFANGLAVARDCTPEDGRIDVVIPAAALTAAKGEPNCIQVCAYPAGGTGCWRNYALVAEREWGNASTEGGTDAEGRPMPPVPLEWIRDNAVEKVPSLACASSPEEFSEVLGRIPSPWGKNTALWRDYLAGTSPDPDATDADLILSCTISNGTPVLTWSPDLQDARVYAIEGLGELGGEEQWHSPTNAADSFFRLKVSLPE